MRKRLNVKWLGYALIGLLFAGSAAGLAYDLSADTRQPEALFWDSVKAGLITPGITCTIDKKTEGRRSVQEVSLDLSSKSDARTRTTLMVNGSEVITDGITTAQHEYVRYLSIRSGSGTKPDFANVMDVWGKQSTAVSDNIPMYDQTTLGGCVLPLGDLKKADADKLVTALRDERALVTDAARSTRQWGWDGPRQRYEVKVAAVPYVHVMKQVAATTGQAGLNSVASTEFTNRAEEKLVFYVDISGRRVERIEFTGREQRIGFSHFGVRPDTRAPRDAIPATELQDRLKAAK